LVGATPRLEGMQGGGGKHTRAKPTKLEKSGGKTVSKNPAKKKLKKEALERKRTLKRANPHG